MLTKTLGVARCEGEFVHTMPAQTVREKSKNKKDEKIRERILRLSQQQQALSKRKVERPVAPVEGWGLETKEGSADSAGKPAWMRLLEALPTWEKRGTKEAAEIVRNGMRVSGAANAPKHDSGECELQGEEAKSTWEQIQKRLRRGVLEECEESELTAMSPLFSQEKSGGRGHRMLCNLEGPNSFAQGKSFRMESIQRAMRMMKKGVFTFCVDMADAFFTIRLHAEDRAVWGTSCTTTTGQRKFYKFLTGVQGGTDTPHCFDALGASFMATASKAGVEATRRCDDCLGFGGMEETAAEREAERFLALMDEFGWKPNVVKSCPHARVSQEVKHLGFI